MQQTSILTRTILPPPTPSFQVLRPVLQGVQGLRDQIPQARDGEGGSDECGGRRRPTRRCAVRRDRVQQQRQTLQEPVDKDVSSGDHLSRRGKGRKTERNSLQANCYRGYNFRNGSAHVIQKWKVKSKMCRSTVTLLPLDTF